MDYMDYAGIIVFLMFLALGYGAGTFNEKRHYRSIQRREEATLSQPMITFEEMAFDPEQIERVEMARGSVVISVDYFKRILAGLRNIFGGAIKSYETLIDRARREALLRMKESAPQAQMIVNVRIETASIGKQGGKKGLVCVEAVAYGTAVFFKQQPS